MGIVAVVASSLVSALVGGLVAYLSSIDLLRFGRAPDTGAARSPGGVT